MKPRISEMYGGPLCPPKPVGTACDELSRVVADPTLAYEQCFYHRSDWPLAARGSARVKLHLN